MTVPALVDDLNPDAVPQQLALADDTLAYVETLRDAGAITATSLDLSTAADLPYERYEALGAYLGEVNRSCSWWIGDWLLFGEGTYGERFAQALTVTGLAEQTLLNRMYVCRHVPPSRRRAALSFSVHAEVAPLPAREQTTWLNRAERGGWNRKQLREAMKATRTDERPPLIGDGEPVEPSAVIEAAQRVVSAKQDYGADYLVPKEPMARLIAALGMEG